MTKKELIDSIAAGADISKKDIGTVLQLLAETIRAECANHREVTLPGLCTFDVGWRGPRKGMNPRTGERMNLPGRHVIKIRPLKALKATLEK